MLQITDVNQDNGSASDKAPYYKEYRRYLELDEKVQVLKRIVLPKSPRNQVSDPNQRSGTMHEQPEQLETNNFRVISKSVPPIVQ
jgi:hypothetical protein